MNSYTKALEGVDRFFRVHCHGKGSGSDDLRSVFALRYAIYCEECGFLPPEKYPEGLESDEYDAQSVQFAAINSKEETVGTARLVCIDGKSRHFPFLEHCPPFAEFEPPPAVECVEVSRLAVHPHYRRRQGDTLFGVNETELTRKPGEKDLVSGERRANAPLLVLGLYREMYLYSRNAGYNYWYAAMEASLARVLGHFGFRFQPIGKRSDYYGPVTPYLGDLRRIEQELSEKNPAMLAWFQSLI